MDMQYNILNFGAQGDGVTNDAAAIQAAIDTCSNAGGGQVYVPGGKVYLSGSIELKSNVNLYLEQGSMIKASENLADFIATDPKIREKIQMSKESTIPSYVNCEYNGKPFQYFIYAKDQENISITGAGIIDGSEEVFYGSQTQYHIEGSYYPRIPLLMIEHVNHLTIKEITVQNSAFWTVHLVGCEDVLIDGIRILNNLMMANCDGIDPDHCKNVRIANCFISCADDCIVFKTSAAYREYGACENIVVTGCTLISTSAAIKFGTESENDFRNIIIENCNITRSNRGISLQLRDGGNIENVQFSNLNIETRKFSDEYWGSAEPISITALDRKTGVKAGHIRNIRFQNINCTSENGIFIHGSEDNFIQDILLENVTIQLRKESSWPIDGYDLRPCAGNCKVNTPISGVYADYADGITIRNLSIQVKDEMKDFMEQEYQIKNVTNITIV